MAIRMISVSVPKVNQDAYPESASGLPRITARVMPMTPMIVASVVFPLRHWNM